MRSSPSVASDDGGPGNCRLARPPDAIATAPAPSGPTIVSLKSLASMASELRQAACARRPGRQAPAADAAYTPTPIMQFPIDLPTMLRDLENRYINAALAQTGSNKKEAAKLLGMGRTTLVEKLRRRSDARPIAPEPTVWPWWDQTLIDRPRRADASTNDTRSRTRSPARRCSPGGSGVPGA